MRRTPASRSSRVAGGVLRGDDAPDGSARRPTSRWPRSSWISHRARCTSGSGSSSTERFQLGRTSNDWRSGKRRARSATRRQARRALTVAAQARVRRRFPSSAFCGSRSHSASSAGSTCGAISGCSSSARSRSVDAADAVALAQVQEPLENARRRVTLERRTVFGQQLERQVDEQIVLLHGRRKMHERGVEIRALAEQRRPRARNARSRDASRPRRPSAAEPTTRSSGTSSHASALSSSLTRGLLLLREKQISPRRDVHEAVLLGRQRLLRQVAELARMAVTLHVDERQDDVAPHAVVLGLAAQHALGELADAIGLGRARRAAPWPGSSAACTVRPAASLRSPARMSASAESGLRDSSDSSEASAVSRSSGRSRTSASSSTSAVGSRTSRRGSRSRAGSAARPAAAGRRAPRDNLPASSARSRRSVVSSCANSSLRAPGEAR